MPIEPPAPVRGRHLDALRAMPALCELGYVEERRTRGKPVRVLWHLTPAGRDLLVAMGEKPERAD